MSTDLLGQPLEDPPPMTAPLPWRVYQVNTVVEWVMARTEREAIDCYLEWCRQCGDHRTEQEMRDDRSLDVMRELSDAELADLTYGDHYDDDAKGSRPRTFADELAALSANARVPRYFATTEY